MNGRNGKPIVTDEKIERVKELYSRGLGLRESASKSGLVYSTAWKIVNGFFNPERRHTKQPKKKSRYFEHDPYYNF